MCEIIKDQLVISSEVKRLYEEVNAHAEIDNGLINALTIEEEKFLTTAMDYVELNWNKPEFNVSTFSQALGYSYSQLYGRLMKLTEKTPNNFIKEFKLHKALELLHHQGGSISQIAEKTCFSSPSYFSECFLNKYGIRPSKYRLQHTSF